MNLKIATWNVERPHTKGWKKPQKNAILNQKIQEIQADIWILTETHAIINPGEDYEQVSTPCFNNGENVVTIYSRYPINKVFQTANNYTIAIEIELEKSSFIVYGTIITYAHDKGENGNSQLWEEHYQQIIKQSQDWQELSKLNIPMCLAGDFNETLKDDRYYGTKKGRKMLEEELAKSNLECLTKHCRIDHICVTKNWAKNYTVHYWDTPVTPDNKPVSDHQGLYVDLSF